MNFIGCCLNHIWKPPPLYILTRQVEAVNNRYLPGARSFPALPGVLRQLVRAPCARVQAFSGLGRAPRWELAKVCHSRLGEGPSNLLLQACRPSGLRPPFSGKYQGAREEEAGLETELELRSQPGSDSSHLACPPHPALRSDPSLSHQITEGRHLSQHRPCA